MPGILFDIAANIVSLQQDFNKANGEINKFARNAERTFKQLQGLLGVASFSYLAQDAVKAFMTAEQASMKMAVAMKNQGDYTKEAHEKMIEFSKVIQRTTAYEDDATLAVMANLKTYGMLNEEVQRATKAALDLASARRDEGMTASQAGDLIGKAYQGQTERLKRYGIIIDETKPKSEAFNDVLTLLGQRFGGAAAADLETYSGKLQQLKNDFGDLKEAAGEALIEKLSMVTYTLMKFSQVIYSTLAAGREFSAWLAEKKAGALDFFGSIETRDLLLKQAEDLRAVAKEFRGLSEEAGLVAQKMWELGETTKSVDKAITKMKDGLRTVTPPDKELAKLASKNIEDNFKRVLDALNDFEKEYFKATHSVTETDIQELNIRYARYKEFVTDEARLEEWLAAEKRNILIKSNNERIALFEELYKGTRQQEFADQALKAMQEVLDSEEKKWADILKKDQWAHDLRLQRERDYIDKLKAMIPAIVDSWQNASQKIANTPLLPSAEPGSSFRQDTQSTAQQAAGFTVYSVGGISFGGDRQAAEAYLRMLEEISQNTKRISEDASRTAQMQAEEAQREQQRLMEERQRAFQSGYGRYQSVMQARERSAWGASEWSAEFDKLGKAFTESTNYEKSLQLLDDMLTALEEIETSEKKTIEQNSNLQKELLQSSESISKWLKNLETSAAAPVQSSAAFAVQFEEYKKKAFGDIKYLDEFLTIASNYLDFEKVFGSTENYKSVYDAVVKSVKALETQYGLYEDLSKLGLGQTITDIQSLTTAFANLGISTDTLKAAAEVALSPLDKTSAAIAGIPIDVQKAIGDDGLKALKASLDTVLPKAVQDVVTGENGLASLKTAIGQSIPDAVKKALGTDGTAALIRTLSDTLPKAIMTASDGGVDFSDSLRGIPADVRQAIGPDGLTALETSLNTSIPTAIRTSLTGADSLDALKVSIGENIPAAVKDALGAEGTQKLIDTLSTSLPAAVRNTTGGGGTYTGTLQQLGSQLEIYLPSAVKAALGNNGLGQLTTMLDSTIPTAVDTSLKPGTGLKGLFDALYNKMPESVQKAMADDKGLNQLFKALGITLPTKAGETSTSADSLGDVLQNTKTPFDNVITAIGNTATTTEENLKKVGSFWDALALKMGMTMNAEAAVTIIGGLKPPVTNTYTQPKYPSYTITQGYWEIPGTDSRKLQITLADEQSGIWSWKSPGTFLDYAHPNYGKGGLTSGLSMAGEMGAEWVVPTYEPQRSSFLQSVGVDSAEIGKQIASQLGGQPIHVHLEVDGREIAYVVAKQARNNSDIADSFRRLS